MMRAFIIAGMVLLLCSCGQVASTAQGEFDNRFGLTPFNMEPILVPDARQCVKISKSVRGQKIEGSDLLKKMFVQVGNFWSYFDLKILKNASSSAGTIELGKVNEDNESGAVILLEKSMSRTAKAEACGEYAGKILVKVGLISVRESLEMAEENQPGIFEEMGLDLSQLNANLNLMEAQASSLDSVTVNTVIDCVAIYQANKTVNSKFAPHSNIWMMALVSSLSAKEVEPTEIHKRSKLWNALVEGGVEELLKIEGVDEDNQRCEALISKAISPQEAGK